MLGINFGTKGFLLHDRNIFERDNLFFSTREYPILHADIQIGDEHIHGHAFNEIYVTRAGDALSLIHIFTRTCPVRAQNGQSLANITRSSQNALSNSWI